jgi:2-polyprenyl-6-methoxyphenol hydroxylase-like FAD-dependent oxidoreductase
MARGGDGDMARGADDRHDAGSDIGERVLTADFVVDCSGRGSQLGAWLEAAGRAAPPVTEIEVDLCYLALVLRRRPTDLDGAKTLVIQNMAPAMTRLGLALAVENDRWMVVLGGYFGDAPPTDRAGYLAFADSLPVPELANLLRLGAPISDPLPYRFRSSRRVHCERAERWPIGLAALGDATCSFNPLYGQGLSVAFMQAEQLGVVLDRYRSLERVAPRVQRELARFTDMAWNIAAGGDLAYPQVAGERPAIGRLLRGYMTKVFRACAVDEEVVDTLVDVTNFVASPTQLLRPAIVARVLRAQRVWRTQQVASLPTTAARYQPS